MSEKIYVNGLWANPPFAVVHRLYLQSRSAVRWTGGGKDTLGMQSWLGRVSAEFHRRLRDAGIYVESSNG